LPNTNIRFTRQTTPNMNNTTPKFLYHYYELAKGPFRNISNVEYDKAQKIISEVSVGFNKNRDPKYLDLRLELEVKLKNAFIAKGGRPTRNDPFYFTLGECKWLETWFGETGIVKMPLSIFEKQSEIVSITHPDSMISYQMAEFEILKDKRKPCNGKVFTIDELEELVSNYGVPTAEQWKNEPAYIYDRYIEVQIWDFEPIQKYLDSI